MLPQRSPSPRRRECSPLPLSADSAISAVKCSLGGVRACHGGCAKVFSLMDSGQHGAPAQQPPTAALYCPVCAKEVADPLTCGDCSSVICRRCGTPLESSDELGMGYRISSPPVPQTAPSAEKPS